MRVCPVDYSCCPDDICHGAGCMQAQGEEMIELCDSCGEEIYGWLCPNCEGEDE